MKLLRVIHKCIRILNTPPHTHCFTLTVAIFEAYKVMLHPVYIEFFRNFHVHFAVANDLIDLVFSEPLHGFYNV